MLARHQIEAMSKPKRPRALPALMRVLQASQPVPTPNDPDAGMLAQDLPPADSKVDPLAGMSREAIERMMGDQSDISFEDD